MPTLNLKKIRAAASMFATGAHPTEIAKELGVSVRSVKRWADTQAWHDALDALGYTGERKFKRKKNRDVISESGEQITQAKSVYDAIVAEGVHHPSKVIRICSERTGIETARLYNWRKRFGWDKKSRKK